MWANGKAAEMLEKMDGVRKIAKLSDYVSSTVHVGIATETFLREHQSVVVKYLLATQEIYDFIAADPQKAAEIMQKTNGTPIPQSLVTFTVWYNYIGFDQKVFDTMESLYQWANERGIIKNPYDLHKYIDVKALQAAFPGKGSFN
jgi:NitT/TauT family transport system substrate-binding protein